MGDERSDMFKWALTGEDIVITFQHILGGEQIQAQPYKEIMPNGETIERSRISWERVSESLLNTYGIQQISSVLYSFLNRNTFLTNLTEKRAMMMARKVLLSANRTLFLEHKNFQLQAEKYDYIITLMLSEVLPAMLRPLDEGERKFFAKTTQEVRQVVDTSRANPQQQGGGGGLFGGLR